MGLYGAKSKFERGRSSSQRSDYDGMQQSAEFQDKAAVVVKATQALDHAKILRQISAALAKTTAQKRVDMLLSLNAVYRQLGEISRLDANKLDVESYQASIYEAQRYLKYFKDFAEVLGWDGSGAQLPRPFNRLFLERLFWQANLILLGPKDGRRPAIAAKKRDFEPFRY